MNWERRRISDELKSWNRRHLGSLGDEPQAGLSGKTHST
jgi:hypothetical protein